MSDERHPFLAGSDEEGFDALALERESLDIWRECAADPGYDIARAQLTWREEAESLAERGIVLADLLHALESQNQALQEALRKIADDGAVNALEDIEDVGVWAAETIHGYKTIARNALSPTQETDRPDIEEIGRGIARDFGKTFDILAKAGRPTQETDPRCPTCNSGDRHFAANSSSTTDPFCSDPWHARPTQETDPE